MIDPIVASQRDLLRKLQCLTDKPILIQRHLKNTWHQWENDIPILPFQTRSILLNELALDLDTKNWDVQKKEGEKLLAFLELDKIPFHMAFSGGKSMHYHIFMDKNTITFPDELHRELKAHPEIDVPCLVREHLTNYIVVKADIDPEVVELDWSNISWSKDGHGSMIRIEGCQRKIENPDNPGKFLTTFKTMVDEIPNQKPDPKIFSLPLRFPDKIELWNISHLQNNIIELLESQIAKCKENRAAMQIARLRRLTTPHTSYKRKCLGFQRAEDGVQEGIRDEVATGLVCACKKWLKIDQEQCREFMHQWAQRCSPAFDLKVIDYKVNRIYGMEKPYSPCDFFIKAGLCEGSQCRIMEAQ